MWLEFAERLYRADMLAKRHVSDNQGVVGDFRNVGAAAVRKLGVPMKVVLSHAATSRAR
jgi:hypothetical protein